MTDPTGSSFLSYRRERSAEAALLISAQREVGIPTWRDVDDLDQEPTEDALRELFQGSSVANAILWLTPGVQQSPVIRRVEARLILERSRQDNDFFVVPVAAGGFSYDEAAEAIKDDIGIEDLRTWNMVRAEIDPIDSAFADEVAALVLTRRVAAFHKRMPAGQPLTLAIYTRGGVPSVPGTSLTLDWTHRFQGREAPPDIWSQYLLPSLETVVQKLQESAAGRAVVAHGLLSIPAAVALGHAFLAPIGINISWEQQTAGRPNQLWSLDAPAEDSGFVARTTSGETSANDLAVLVSVNVDVADAVNASRVDLPGFRAYVQVTHRDSGRNDPIDTPGEAAHVARLVASATRKARSTYNIRGNVHLFMAVPVGIALLIGQLLNTLGAVQTYEHIQDGATGYYRPAASLGR